MNTKDEALVWEAQEREGYAAWFRAELHKDSELATASVFPPTTADTTWSLHAGVSTADTGRMDTVTYFAARPTDAQVRAEVALIRELVDVAAARRKEAK